MKTQPYDYQLIRVWKKTHKTLKVLAALYQESLMEFVDRLAEEERTMKHFEYRTVELHYSLTTAPVLQYDEQTGPGTFRENQDISTLGEQGWELVTLTERPANNSANRPKPTLVGVFKREKRSID